MTLTNRQQKFLDLLEKFITKHDYPPTLEEMKIWLEQNKWGEIRSLNSVKQYLDALEKDGAIRREHKKRGITLTDKSTGEKTEQQINETVLIPLLGSPVACGSPTGLIDETAIDQIKCSRKLLRNPGKTYAFRASGDSMNHAGIDDNDFVLIEATTDIQDNDIVLANIEGCGTLKRYRKGWDTITLSPESDNPEHKPIYLHSDEEFIIAGKVINVLKN